MSYNEPQRHFVFSNDHFSYWLIVVFPFFTITLFVVQDNLANKIQNAKNVKACWADASLAQWLEHWSRKTGYRSLIL